jgi:hypothetical protein
VNAPRRYGPWAPELAPTEMAARFRELRALASLLLWREDEFLDLLNQASVGDVEAADAAWRVMHELPARRVRRLLTSFAALGAPK